MIQDIAPRHLDNQYRNITPDAKDTIFFFEGNTVLASQNGDSITYPEYGDFIEKVKKASGTDVNETYDFIYLFCLTDKKIGEESSQNDNEQKFFLALPKRKVQKGAFLGEMADSGIHAEYENIIEGYDFTGVNVFRNAKPKELAFAAITAYHLYGWYRDNRYCGRCGRLMFHGENERMMHCMDCKNTVYPKICPAVIVAVTDGDRILLTKYAGRTYRNYALIAGFTEIGETVEETVMREVYEEVGVHVKNLRYYKSQPWALSGSLLYGYFCELDGDDSIHLQEDELSVGKWFHADELDIEEDDVSLTREMICKFVNEHKTK